MRKISDQTGVHRKAVNKYLAKAKHSGHGFVDLLSFTDEALSLVLLDTIQLDPIFHQIDPTQLFEDSGKLTTLIGD
jgi:hypothetical protein